MALPLARLQKLATNLRQIAREKSNASKGHSRLEEQKSAQLVVPEKLAIGELQAALSALHVLQGDT